MKSNRFLAFDACSTCATRVTWSSLDRISVMRLIVILFTLDVMGGLGCWLFGMAHLVLNATHLIVEYREE